MAITKWSIVMLRDSPEHLTPCGRQRGPEPQRLAGPSTCAERECPSRRLRDAFPPRAESTLCECVLGRLVAQKRGDLRVRLKLRQILHRRQLRLVARGVHHAEEAERLAPGGAELMPGHRRHGHEVAGLDRSDLAADETMAAPAQDQHR